MPAVVLDHEPPVRGRVACSRTRRVQWYLCCSWHALLTSRPVSRGSATNGSEEEVVGQRRSQVRFPADGGYRDTETKQRQSAEARVESTPRRSRLSGR